jgi:Trehalose utilisation.
MRRVMNRLMAPAMWRFVVVLFVIAVIPVSAVAAAEVAKPRLLVVIAEKEYETRETLPAFAEAHLADTFAIDYVTAADEEGRNNLAGLEKAEDYDLILVSVRRRAPKVEQLAAFRRYVAAGKPLVVIRTSCHAFSLRGEPPPEGHAVWEHFDTEVLGCHYANHHKNGIVTTVERDPNAAAAGSNAGPLLEGVTIPFASGGSLYLVNPLTAATRPLLVGTIDGKPAEPVAWTTTSPGGGRVFATTLGHVSDFANESFCRLLANGTAWAAAGAPLSKQ